MAFSVKDIVVNNKLHITGAAVSEHLTWALEIVAVQCGYGLLRWQVIVCVPDTGEILYFGVFI